MDQNKWFIINLYCSPGDRDRIVELLWESGTIGLEEIEKNNQLLLKAFFPIDQISPDFTDVLKIEAESISKNPVTLLPDSVEFDPEEWIRNYRTHCQGIRIGNDLYIYPSWLRPSSEAKFNIRIEPSHAFGTGTHESTRLAIEALNGLDSCISSAVDVGTGSGILAISIALLNPETEIVALDISSQSVQAARENLISNGQLDRVRLVIGEPAVLKARFDLVVANLTLEIFRNLAVRLLRLSGKHLIVSGFTEEQENVVSAIFSRYADLRLDGLRRENGWSCFHFVKLL